MAEWFESWFNTDEYLNVYRHRNQKEAAQLVRLILDNVKLDHGSKILDLACGAGRHSVLFAEKGYNVTAVDLSDTLLKVAVEHARSLELNIKFLKSDLRYLELDDKYDLIVNLFTSFGYFDSDSENISVMEKAFRFVKPGGYFVLDFLNKYYVEENLAKYSEEPIDGGLLLQERKIENKRVIKKITIRKNNHEEHYSESVRLFDYEELTGIFKRKGLAIKKTFGDFNGNCFDMVKSPRIILIAEK